MKQAIAVTSVFLLCALSGYALRSLVSPPPVPMVTGDTPEAPSTSTEPPDSPLGSATLESTLAELPRARYEPARARIWGRVRTADREPVANARIEARPRR